MRKTSVLAVPLRHLNTSIFRATTVLALLAGGAHAQEAFNLETMIEAAKKEPPITVYAVTGKIVDTAQSFTKKFGVQATGKKVNEATQIELMIREHQAGKVVGDVSVATDVASAVGQLLPEGIATSWTPPDLQADIPEKSRNPLVVVSDPHVWTYNNRKIQQVPCLQYLATDTAGMEGQTSHARPVRQAALRGLVQPDGAEPRCRDCASLRAQFGKKTGYQQGKRNKGLGQGFRPERAASLRQHNGGQFGGRTGSGCSLLRHHVNCEISR